MREIFSKITTCVILISKIIGKLIIECRPGTEEMYFHEKPPELFAFS